MAKELLSSQSSPSAGASIVIPCPPEKFGNFLGELLSRKSRVRKRVVGAFVIGPEQIEDIESLIITRLEEQNRYSLVEFEASIFFSDRRSHRIHSLEDLKRFSPMSAGYAHRLRASWSFLIYPPGEGVPSRYVVQMIASCGSERKFDDLDLYMNDRERFFGREPEITVEVEYDRVSLADDLLNLVYERVKGWTKDHRLKSPITGFPYDGFLATSGGIFGLGMASLVTNYLSRMLLDSSLEFEQALLSGRFTVTIVVAIFLSIMFVVVGVVLGGSSYEMLAPKNHGAIVFETVQRKTELEKVAKAAEGRGKVYAMMVASICIGVVSSLIATGLWENLTN